MATPQVASNTTRWPWCYRATSRWIRSFNLPPAAITTHRHVDLGGERDDPRSFDWSKLQTRLAALGDLCVS